MTARASRTPTRAPRVTRSTRLCRRGRGHVGISTRFAFKILSKVFNYDSTEVVANLYRCTCWSSRSSAAAPAELETKYTGWAKEYLSPRHAEFIGKERSRQPTWRATSTARTSSTATSPTPTTGSRTASTDTDTGEVFDRNALNAELRRSRSPRASPTLTSATRSSTSRHARANNQGKNLS